MRPVRITIFPQARKRRVIVQLHRNKPGVSTLNVTVALLKYDVWWVNHLIGVVAITFGHRIYTCHKSYTELSCRLVLHEMKHVLQYEEDGFFKFIGKYLWQWISVGFRYSKICYEIDAVEYSQQSTNVDFLVY